MPDALTEDLTDLEEIIRATRGKAGDDLRTLLAARERAAEAGQGEAHLLPEPEFPGPLGTGAVRWSCRHRCGWSHTEHPGLERPGPLVLPADFRPEDITAAVTREAEARHQALQARVLEAVTAHYAAEHPEHQEDQ